MFLRGKVPSVELTERMEIDLVNVVVNRNWLRWLGHVLWKDVGEWKEGMMFYEVDGVRGRRLRMTWNEVVKKNMRDCGLNKVDASDWIKWRRLVWESTS